VNFTVLEWEWDYIMKYAKYLPISSKSLYQLDIILQFFDACSDHNQLSQFGFVATFGITVVSLKRISSDIGRENIP